MAKGMKNAQDLRFAFPNFIESDGLIRILKYTKLDSDMGKAVFLSYQFSLRAPSETFRLTRTYKDDRAGEFAHQEDMALITIIQHNQIHAMVIKFAFRGNIRNGCIPMRPCLCSGPSKEAHDLRPVHMAWPHIRGRVKAGGPLPPGLAENNFNRKLKQTTAALKFPDGQKYSSHAFRMGATDEIKK